MIDASRETAVSQTHEHIQAQLQTTKRAWNQLPPLTTARTGWRARLELWIKFQLKRATHWFTWEQRNFNQATNDALHDIHAALLLQEQLIVCLQDQIAANTRDQHAAMEQAAKAFLIKHDDAETTMDAVQMQAQIGEEVARQFAMLRDEQQARINDLLDEQRVSFKQLSMQIGEVTIAAGRAAPRAESRLDELEKQVVELRAARRAE